jgi:ribosomal protein S12 methylthiotransferase accessory factor
MGKPAQPRSESADSALRSTIYVFGARANGTFGRALKETCDRIVFFQDARPTFAKTPDLAIGICERCDDPSLSTFHAWAHSAAVPALRVEVGAEWALIGPLSLSGRPGCGYCAYARLTAAAASAETHPQVFSKSKLAKAAAPVLAEQVRAILRDGTEQSELLNHVLICDSETFELALHKFIPLSDCVICGGAAAFPLVQEPEPVELSPAEPPEVVLGVLQGWVDSRIGIVSSLFIEPPADPDAMLPITAVAGPPHIMEADGKVRRLPLGWGKGLTISGAVLSAVGEAIERYAASRPDPNRIVWAKPSEIDEFLDPRDGALYTDAQYESDGFPYVRFDPDIQHPWVQGKWLKGGAPVFVAAIDVFLSIEIRKENLFSQGTSNGLAAATNFEEAALRATLELIERDAFMAAWLTETPGRPVKLDHTLDPSLRLVLDGIEKLGAQVEIYALPISVCGTTILCLALGNGETYPGITFGLGCDLDANLAVRQALLELGQTGPYLKRMMQSKHLATPRDASSVREMLDHAAYYFPQERATVFDRLRGTAAPLLLSDLPRGSARSLSDCAAELDAAGVRVALVDVTSADVATGPFHVVRAVSNALQPISYGYGLDRRRVERLSRINVAARIPPISPIW